MPAVWARRWPAEHIWKVGKPGTSAAIELKCIARHNAAVLTQKTTRPQLGQSASAHAPRDAPRRPGTIYFSSTHVVMHRMFCTFVVFSGSASVPPNVDVQARRVRSSTTKRSEPSGSRTRPVAAER